MNKQQKEAADRATREGGQNEERGSRDAQRALGRKPAGRSKRAMRR